MVSLAVGHTERFRLGSEGGAISLTLEEIVSKIILIRALISVMTTVVTQQSFAFVLPLINCIDDCVLPIVDSYVGRALIK